MSSRHRIRSRISSGAGGPARRSGERLTLVPEALDELSCIEAPLATASAPGGWRADAAWCIPVFTGVNSGRGEARMRRGCRHHPDVAGRVTNLGFADAESRGSTLPLYRAAGVPRYGKWERTASGCQGGGAVLPSVRPVDADANVQRGDWGRPRSRERPGLGTGPGNCCRSSRSARVSGDCSVPFMPPLRDEDTSHSGCRFSPT